MNNWRALAWLGLMVACLSPAQVPTSVTVRSRSGQFTIHGLPLGKPLLNQPPASSISHVRVDPMLLSVAAENVKDALLAALGQADHWQAPVTISVQPLEKDHQEIVVASIRYTDGWRYAVRVPEHVKKDSLVCGLLEVLLLEMAQRNAANRRLEVPPWLAPGLAAHLSANAAAPLIVDPQSITAREHRVDHSLKETRTALATRAGLNLDQLNWPDARTDPIIYEASAHIFVRELLRRPGGSLAMSDMLSRLRDYLNWQTAFLHAFRFASLREVDKWWTLQLIQFAGRESPAQWSAAEARGQLDRILETPITVRQNANELPIVARASLQTVLKEWDLPRQRPLLEQKLQHLEALRLRAPRAVSELVDEYRKALSKYLQSRAISGRGQSVSNPKVLLATTIKKLDELDLRKEAIAPLPSGTPTLSDAQTR